MAGSIALSGTHGIEGNRQAGYSRSSSQNLGFWDLVRNRIDWPLILVTLALATVGVLAVHSATLPDYEGTGLTDFARNQLGTVFLGLIMMVAIALPDYRRFEYLYPVWWLISVGGLVATQLVGISAKGAHSWIQIGGLRLQPSEFSKVFLVMFLAGWLSRIETRNLPLLKCIVPGILALIPIYLVNEQPDLGTAICMVAVLGGMMLMRGMNLAFVTVVAVLGIGIVVGGYPYWFKELKPHQQDRILALLQPELYKKGASFQAEQGKTAIGSGRLWGKGFGRGTQHRLQYLPEDHTDFIFAVIAEDLGLAGVATVFGLMLMLLVISIRAGFLCTDTFGVLLVHGVVIMIFFQAFVNMAMLVGWMPVTGLPLPFLSYGRTALLATMSGVGLILNVRMHS